MAWLASVSGALGRISTALGDEAGGARHFKRAAELLEEIDTVSGTQLFTTGNQ